MAFVNTDSLYIWNEMSTTYILKVVFLLWKFLFCTLQFSNSLLELSCRRKKFVCCPSAIQERWLEWSYFDLGFRCMSAVSVEVEGDTWEWHSAVVFPGFWSFLDATAGCCCKPACSPLSWSTSAAQVGEREGGEFFCTELTHKMEEN